MLRSQHRAAMIAEATLAEKRYNACRRYSRMEGFVYGACAGLFSGILIGAAVAAMM
jgi:hypothetical protein